MNLGLSGFLQLDGIISFYGGEEIVGVDGVECGIYTIDAPDALNEACWIPGDIVVDDNVGAMQVDAFGLDLGTELFSVFIARIKGIGVEVGNDVSMFRLAGFAGEQQGPGLDFITDMTGQILGGLL